MDIGIYVRRARSAEAMDEEALGITMLAW